MNFLITVLVRSVVIGALLTAYVLAIPTLFPDKGDGANIGAGLLAFAGLALVAFGWALLDGLRQEFAWVLGRWCLVAAVVTVGALVTRASIESEDSLSIVEVLVLDASLLPVGFSNIFFPALVGAGIGRALSRPAMMRRKSPPLSPPGS